MNNLLWFVAGAFAYKWWNDQQVAAAAANQPAPTSPVTTLLNQFLNPNQAAPPITCPAGQVAQQSVQANGVASWRCYTPMPVY